MKFRTFIIGAIAALLCISCDDTTATLGSSLTDNMDHLEVLSDTFKVTSRSIAVDSVYARSSVCYLGTIRDPETGEYIKSNFMTQFHTIEDYTFPEIDSIMSRDANGGILADSVEIRLFFDDFYGDSCTSMKLTAYELDHPVKDGKMYYSNYNPADEGFVRQDGLKTSLSYAITDMNVPRNQRDNTEYTKNIRIPLNQPYTDKNGVTYNNYGTYVMRTYYQHPEYFKNSVSLINHVCPGFFIESAGGLGSMAYIKLAQLNLYFQYKSGGKTHTGTTSFSGTEEVLCLSTVLNDRSLIKQLVDDETCTYLKTPSGIVTELTLPVDDIVRGHDNDSINTANLTITRLNDRMTSDYSFSVPQNVLLMPADSLYSFFENRNIANYKTSFLATYSSSTNTYVFNNIGSVITAMHQAKQKGEATENWNKVVLVPVSPFYMTYQSTQVLTRLSNDMSFTSTRLVGGAKNPHAPITVNVIYSKYK